MTKQNDRVQKNTPEPVNQDIEQQLRENIRFFSKRSKKAISKQIDELEKEWNMDRTLLTNASILASIGLILGVTVHKKWLIMPGIISAFLLQHGLQGWCPPLPLFRKLGVRSFKEIDRERFALKYLRGDFSSIESPKGKVEPDQLIEAISK